MRNPPVMNVWNEARDGWHVAGDPLNLKIAGRLAARKQKLEIF
jgi:hypothetical protein